MQPTQPLFRRIRRLALTTKQANKGFYKGTGSGSMGWHTKHGGYRIDYNKVRTYVVPPDLATFRLTPFVTRNMDPLEGEYDYESGDHPVKGEYYLENWRRSGGNL